MNRCPWCEKNDLYIKYHDQEWGLPVFDDRRLFEFLILESAQAGLNWLTILKRRENYRKAYNNFDPLKVASYDDNKIAELVSNPGIIRYKRKIEASINNAKCFIDVQHEFGSFSDYIWGFVDFKPIINTFTDLTEIPAQTSLSQKVDEDLKKRGFKFIGPTIIYAYLQAIGIVNDHLQSCFRYKEIISSYSEY
ncbi:DNA-3-methyladenine glycosylase I [Iocasia frigidifontis]|uniref:DNA-3-methyladenine glycosylase I n=1 Tax=Iocasia fonsfrigidae TaxID=2682810 RepID=A0A8A7KBF7_9FIRM|nr:DNA-3-methyladenine glycosylase I [Iocasia fonsfrigidae]QTL96669.1 DNA-3-methyladenine glycosylase I [Iocasia fonsfrigidae]